MLLLPEKNRIECHECHLTNRMLLTYIVYIFRVIYINAPLFRFLSDSIHQIQFLFGNVLIWIITYSNINLNNNHAFNWSFLKWLLGNFMSYARDLGKTLYLKNTNKLIHLRTFSWTITQNIAIVFLYLFSTTMLFNFDLVFTQNRNESVVAIFLYTLSKTI